MLSYRRFLHSLADCLLLLGLLAATLFPASPARADMAPPVFPPGSNLEPGTVKTYVQMVSEVVTFSVMKESGNYRFPYAQEPDEVGQARVNAVFNMRNQGQAAEQMEARFPLSSWMGDGYTGYPEIFDLSVKVNGNRVATHRIERSLPHGAEENAEQYAGPWAAFPVSFPVGEDVRVEINYTSYGATERPITTFGYILETGAGWYGTIGSADIILRLPYAVSTMNTLIPADYQGGYTIKGNEMRWHYADLEPAAENNMDLPIILPAIWNRIAIETENVTSNPKDGEAWGRLGKAYKETIYSHGRPRCWQGEMPEAYQKSFEAYSKTVELLPKDGLWHYGFADLLWSKIGFCNPYGEVPLSEEEKQLFGRELRLALSLEPGYEALRFLDMEVKNGYEDLYNQYVLQLPTVTPSLTLTSTATETASPTPRPTNTQAPIPTITLTPSPTQTAVDVVVAEDTAVPAATPTPKPSGSTSICGGAAVIPLLTVVLVLRKKNSRKAAISAKF